MRARCIALLPRFISIVWSPGRPVKSVPDVNFRPPGEGVEIGGKRWGWGGFGEAFPEGLKRAWPSIMPTGAVTCEIHGQLGRK